MKTTMAIDQYGNVQHDLGKYPRKVLLERLGRKHASKVYRDRPDGSTVHVGYVIACRWFDVFNVERWERKA